ncbi:MAG: hypothetical protein GY727_16160 [Gammaproteobacteria bacterium]|nr:hypothetical protein [Gammaproteobacteria bacterium]MCP4089174.1 hypothetical protein [Gammaproteobacteria bacterium]MCP4276802.1 hypothetical protein [Gammaproteobacteria bacterium]MCP4830645.1 hypothetical protein [Gammaproteobacteria bacterium]MCP4928454.1 hypothetical protein [Gammaproteobacteria bacterium]
MDNRLLDILCCPITRRPLVRMDETLLAEINTAIVAGKVRNHGGESLTEILTGGLVSQDGDLVYPVRDDIPVLLEEECIHWAAFKG